MKKNLSIKIFSFIFAFFIWIVVYNIYDPIITVSINNIPINIQNENELYNINKVYSIVGDKNINIYLKGKQSIIKSIKRDDIIATADLSRLSEVNSVKVNVEIEKYNANQVEIIYGKYDTLKVSLDNLVSKKFDLNVLPINQLNDKYYLNDNNIKQTIEISGAQQLINKISTVYIEPDLNELTPNYNKKFKIKAKDNFNSDVDLSSLKLNISEYDYKPTVYETKDVALNIKYIGKVDTGYEVIENSHNPKTVKITGTSDELKKINSLNIDYNISEIKKSDTIKIKLIDYLKNKNIKLIDESTEVIIKISLEEFIIKNLELTTSDVSIKNMPENMTVNYLQNDNLLISVRGKKNVLNNLSIKDLNCYIDFYNLTLGTHSIPINISNDKVELINSNNINFELKTLEKEKEILNSTEIETEIEKTEQDIEQDSEQVQKN